MNKRRCGTCRFFQEAGLAGSGWCHHPQRRTTSDVLLMVRRNELACRDEWSHDLWAVAGGDALPAAAAVGPVPRRPEAPATPGEIAAVVQTSTVAGGGSVVRSGAVQEDVVLGEARLIAEAEPDWTWGREDAAATREVDTRAAIMKAREAYRERAKAAAAGARPMERAGDDPPPAPPLLRPMPDAPRSRTDAAETGDAGSTDPAAPAPSRAAEQPLQATRETDVEEATSRSGRAMPPPVRPNTVGEPAVRLEAWSAATEPSDPRLEFRDESDAPAWELDRRGPRRTEPRPADRAWDSAADGYGTDLADPRPVTVAGGGAAGGGWTTVAGGSADAASDDAGDGARTAPNEEAERDDEPRVARLASDPVAVPVREVVARNGWWADEGIVPLAEDEPGAGFAVTAVAGRAEPDGGSYPAAAPVGSEIALAPALPRLCRTCRDFRPAEGGGRGWCANEWAFTHRRVVDPEDAMPCETSLGSWWLPADEVWLAAADVSDHGYATPLLDAVVALRPAAPERRQRRS